MEHAYEAGDNELPLEIEDDIDIKSIESAGEVQQRQEEYQEQQELKPVDFEDSPHEIRPDEDDKA